MFHFTFSSTSWYVNPTTLTGLPLQVAKTVGPSLVRSVLTISLEQTTKFIGAYMEAVTEFKDRHFEDRSVRKYFTHYVIAVANNCLQFQQLFDKSYTDCCSGQAAIAKGDNETSQVVHVAHFQ